MSKMTGFERFKAVLELREPDCVPHGDLVCTQVREAILPGATYEDFIEHMDLDFLCSYDKLFSWKWDIVDEAEMIVRTQWGGLAKLTADQPHPLEPAIQTEADLDKYQVPDPDDPTRYHFLEGWIKRFKGERAIVAHATDIFDIARESILGDVPYFTQMITNPDFIQRVNDMILDYNLRYLENCIELGVDGIFISGDFATTNAPMASRDHVAKFLTPPLKAMVDMAHSKNIPVFKHSDGDIRPIFDLMLDTGIDGIHPIDPMAGLDLGEMKEQYGDKICLMGNVDCAYTLCNGTREEVRAEVKECIRKGAPGGGYVCTSSNSIHSGVKPENYLTMVEAIREFGKYPLELD